MEPRECCLAAVALLVACSFRSCCNFPPWFVSHQKQLNQKEGKTDKIGRSDRRVAAGGLMDQRGCKVGNMRRRRRGRVKRAGVSPVAGLDPSEWVKNRSGKCAKACAQWAGFSALGTFIACITEAFSQGGQKAWRKYHNQQTAHRPCVSYSRGASFTCKPSGWGGPVRGMRPT